MVLLPLLLHCVFINQLNVRLKFVRRIYKNTRPAARSNVNLKLAEVWKTTYCLASIKVHYYSVL
jgi:hypothetical protein